MYKVSHGENFKGIARKSIRVANTLINYSHLKVSFMFQQVFQILNCFKHQQRNEETFAKFSWQVIAIKIYFFVYTSVI